MIDTIRGQNWVLEKKSLGVKKFQPAFGKFSTVVNVKRPIK